jgi:hypothetical protein
MTRVMTAAFGGVSARRRQGSRAGGIWHLPARHVTIAAQPPFEHTADS